MRRLTRFLSWLRWSMYQDVGRLPSKGTVAALASLVALLSLSYLVGAAAMYFRLPTSVFLTRAFTGAQDWTGAEVDPLRMAPHRHLFEPILTLNQKEKTANGYTLCITQAGTQETTLRDMQGKVVHQWKLRSRLAWMRSPHVLEPLPDEAVFWGNGRVCPDGSLIALCARNGQPYGYGLVKLDKDSQVLWAYSANVHHDFDVGDDGRVYVLTQHIDPKPPPGLPGSPEEFFAEDLVVLSPEGQHLVTIPLYEALHDSDFAMLFAAQLWRNLGHSHLEGKYRGDVLHANSVKVLPRALAARFPQFQPGWVLVSFRSSSILAVIDPDKGQVVWAAIGPWQAQHDAQFLEDGHLLLFDNAGSPKGARVLEYDPATQAIPWAYTSEEAPRPLDVPSRGACQRLFNGNTLIVVPLTKVFEVTANKETVWEMTMTGLIVARRYAPEQVPFLANASGNDH
jgi:hypothetical protein